jgi:hypothetical protein
MVFGPILELRPELQDGPKDHSRMHQMIGPIQPDLMTSLTRGGAVVRDGAEQLKHRLNLEGEKNGEKKRNKKEWTSADHRVKINKITPASGKERGDVEIRDYVILQKPRDLTDCLPPPRTLILDFTLTHTCFGKSQLSSLGQLTHTRRTDGVPEPDGTLRSVARAKIRHYRQLYINRPEPIDFMSVVVDTADRIYDDFSRLLFLHTHREESALSNELPEESEQFRFLRAVCFANIKGSVGLILVKASAMRISIPFDLSSRSFIPLPCFMRSRRVTPLLAPSLVFAPRRFA